MTDIASAHVSRTLRALELLASEPQSQSELARGLGVHPRTVRRLLERLLADGYALEVGPGRRYTLTLKVVALAGMVIDRSDVARLAAPYVTQLRDITGETAHLCVPRGTGVMHLVQEIGEASVAVKSRIGEVVPLHSTAVGKAVLAHKPSMWTELFASGLPRFTDHTLTDPADLLLELQAVRERGFAIDDRESELELRCVAAPVFARDGALVGALGVSVPSSRLSREQALRMGETIRALTVDLSTVLGHRRAPAKAS